MTTAYINPLNLKYIFQNVFAGNGDVFFILFMLGISILAGVFRMNNMTFLVLIGLSSVMLYSWFGGGFYVTVIFITGLIVFWGVKRIVRT